MKAILLLAVCFLLSCTSPLKRQVKIEEQQKLYDNYAQLFDTYSQLTNELADSGYSPAAGEYWQKAMECLTKMEIASTRIDSLINDK